MTEQDRSIDQNPPRTVEVFATDYVSAPISAALLASGVTVEKLSSDHVEAKLAKDGDRCVILWQDPADAMATAMEAGHNLDAVVDAWSTSAEELLSLFRRNRRQMLLVDARTLADRKSEAARDTLCSKLHLDRLARPLDPPALPTSKLAQLLARFAIPQIPSVRKRLEELEASSDVFSQEALSSADLNTAASMLKQISEENELLKTQIALQQKELERLLEEQRFASATSEKALARTLADLRTEAKSRVRLQEERDGLESKVGDLSRRLEEVFASTSWKVTKPMRWVKLHIIGVKS